MSRAHQINILKVLVVVLIISFMIAGGLYVHTHQLLGRNLFKVLRDLITQAGVWGPFVVLGFFALQTFIPVPYVVLATITGALYGPWLGTLIVVVGWCISATVSFYTGRYVGQKWVDNHEWLWVRRYRALVEDQGFVTVMLMRVLQFPSDIVGVLCGVTHLPYQEYIVATLLGVLPGAVTFTVLGRSWHQPLAWFLFGGMFLATIGVAVMVQRVKWIAKKP